MPFLLLLVPILLVAQDDPGETPLGDVARSLRKKPAAEQQEVIDNDNFSNLMEDAESRRVSGASLLFSLDPGGKSFHVSSPDVTCSLSFSSNASSLLADPIALDELPRNELSKLDGPATIDGDSLQLSLHNATDWDLREVIVGLTIVRRTDVEASSYYGAGYGSAKFVPALAGASSNVADATAKHPDVTVLLRIKGAAAPSTTAIFRTPLNFALFPDQEWHWAIVRAKGIAPAEKDAVVPATSTASPTGSADHLGSMEVHAPASGPVAVETPRPQR